MRILVSGSSGLIGSQLMQRLLAEGHDVVRLVRQTGVPNSVLWNPEQRDIDVPHLNDCDAVIHLCGENIGDGRWTKDKMRRIRSSRVESTRLLCEKLATLPNPPRVFLAASATGIYGHRPGETLDENSVTGTGFLAEVCSAWESASVSASRTGIRTVHLRFGAMLTSQGAFLQRLLPWFRMGLGGNVGRGRQYWTWISLVDAISAILHVLRWEDISGAVNVVSPEPATNAEITRAIAKAVHRPAILPAPPLLLSLLYGSIVKDVLCASQRVVPTKLLESGFQFRFPGINAAIEEALCERNGSG